MSQISPPIRILLVGAVVFLAAWFTVLKPKPATFESASPAPAAKQTTLGKAVDKAKTVAAKAAATATPAAEPTTTAPAAAAAPAVAIADAELAKLPAKVADALKARKILVLGVFADGATKWRPMADDDRYVRNALRRTNRYDGEVVVQQVDISKLSTYGALVNDLHVNQSPSIVVIDRELKGRVLTGYVDRISINQTIADARDATTTPDIADPYLRRLNSFCGDHILRFGRWSLPTVRGEKPAKASLERLRALSRQSRRELARTDAPPKWRSLKAHMSRVLAQDAETAESILKLIERGDLDGAVAAINDQKQLARELDRRFNDVGLTNCAFNRQS